MTIRPRTLSGFLIKEVPRLYSLRGGMKSLRHLGIVVLALMTPSLLQGQEPSDAANDLTLGDAITLKLIMSDQDWLGGQPESAYWGDLNQHFYYSRKRPGTSIRDRYRASLDEPTEHIRVKPVHAARESVAEGVWQYDPEKQSYSEKVYIREGDVYHRHVTTGHITQLTRTTTHETQPMFLNDGTIGFRRGDHFLVRDLETGLESEPFPLVFDKAPEDKKLEEAKDQSLLSRQQERLFHTIQNKEKEQTLQEAEQRLYLQEDPSLPGIPFYLGDDVELGSAVMSPSGRHLAVELLPKKRSKPSKTSMPSWVTHSGDIEMRDVRSKVGSVKPYHSKLLLLDRMTRQTIEIKTDELPGIRRDDLKELKASAKLREEHRKKALEDASDDSVQQDAEKLSKSDPGQDAGDAPDEEDESKPRVIQFRSLSFNQDGSALVFQAFSFDNKDRWLASVDLESGACRPLHHLHDPAWINWRHNEFGWSRDGTRIWFLSEETGFSHLYAVDLPDPTLPDADVPKPEPLTRGNYIVTEPQLSVEGRFLYFRANREHPGQYEIYRTTMLDGTVEQISNLGGMSSALLSPNGRHLLITHSTSTRPPELFIQRAEPFAPAVKRTETLSEAFARRSWITPKHVEVPSRHGQKPIHSRLYLPKEDPVEKRPAVLFVHGAGYLQNAHKGWSGYAREFMFHSFLVERGCVVLDMDYRASAGYGRDWRTSIYRHMGSVELEDLRDGVDWLVEHHHIDPERVGVYGGSYGGFLTLMALFNEPDLFAAGAALRPVTDWAHYNHSYTSRILNTPEVDPEAYRKSSPIEFAQGLTKPLLICAPMLDDNVFFQDSVRLAQRLIELEKEHWWMAVYPVEPHGFREPASWLDEYRRIWGLFERHLFHEPHHLE